MKSLDNMTVIAESRRQSHLEEANREYLAKIAQSDRAESNPLLLLLTNLFRHSSKRSTASGEQPSSIRRIFRLATPR